MNTLRQKEVKELAHCHSLISDGVRIRCNEVSIVILFAVLGTEFRVSCMLGKHSNTAMELELESRS